MTISTHIVRRSIEYAHSGLLAATEVEQPGDGDGDGDGARISPIAALIFMLSAFALIFTLFSVCDLFYVSRQSL